MPASPQIPDIEFAQAIIIAIGKSRDPRTEAVWPGLNVLDPFTEFVSYNLAEIVACREQDGLPHAYEYDAPEMRIDQYCPGWTENERERLDGEALRHGLPGG